MRVLAAGAFCCNPPTSAARHTNVNQPPYGPPGPPWQPPPPRRVRVVTKQRGLTAGSHSIHLILSVFTCGAWLPVWGCVWVYRLFVRRKQVTTYRPR